MTPAERRAALWREYPERDPEYVRWYPPALAPIAPETIWDAPAAAAPAELALYVHVPFCATVCKYCPFLKLPWDPVSAARFVDDLRDELALAARLPALRGRRVVAAYLGGGTPTVLTPDQLGAITARLRESFDVARGAELSLEANPDSVSLESLRAIRALGFDRISFGVQSFDDDLLARIGRTHRARAAREVLALARDAGFDNVALDLIYALPSQTVARWKLDLREAVSAGADHVTAFRLHLAPGTALHRELRGEGADPLPSDGDALAMLREAEELLGSAGFEQYTAYDFARPGKSCLHHRINWRAPQGEYLGLGPGAFSYVQGHVFANTGDLAAYASAIRRGVLPVAIGCAVTPREEMARFLVLGLKCLAVSKAAFRERFGLTLSERFGAELRRLEAWGLVTEDDAHVRVTDKGRGYLANVSKAFYTPEQRGVPQPRVPSARRQP